MTNWGKIDNTPRAVFTELLPLNNHEFVIVPQRHANNRKYSKDSDGVHKYDSINNKWTKIFDYPKDFASLAHKAAIDIKNNIIYICNIDKLLEINLTTNNMKILSNQINLDEFPGVFFANDCIHVIGGESNNKHYIFNRSCNKFDLIHDFDSDNLTICQRSFYFAKNKSIINTVFDDKNKTSIIEFKNNKWNLMDFKIQNEQHLTGSEIIATTNGNYLIFIDGTNLEKNEMDHFIYIYDVKAKDLIKSDVKMPENISGTAATSAITRNNDKENLLTFGFVNQCFNTKNYENMQQLPFYLIKLIEKWVCFETMHVIIDDSTEDKIQNTHWIIDVDTILSSIFN